jgi:glutamate N-acetyltransferase/amino-acid N-acetyltransferase
MFKYFSVKGGVSAPEGFYSGGVSAGLKNEGKLDLGFIYSDTKANVGAIFTDNKLKASPLKHFIKNDIQETNFILVNSKNANAMTGEKGIRDIEDIFSQLSEKFKFQNPIMSSTGVIGVHLPVEKIVDGAKTFDLNKKDNELFAEAIMTTDAYKKEIALKVELEDGRTYHIGGVTKGAGMINPSMATMLAFITTDLDIPRDEIIQLLQTETKTTFNAISVDGDTSTNDSVFLLANGKKEFYDQKSFKEALHVVMKHLALAIVRDGEGAKKVASFVVRGAKSDEDAEKIAKTLSDSLLVKTALFGEDPNWGRIAMAIGASGVEVSEENISISYEDVKVLENGINLFDDEVEEKAFRILKREEFTIYCDLGMGSGEFKSYGCDLGYEYVKINADYRT